MNIILESSPNQYQLAHHASSLLHDSVTSLTRGFLTRDLLTHEMVTSTWGNLHLQSREH